jgi:DNA (cytosine-5)-methyltransferase 1
MFSEYVRLLRGIRPKTFIAENVTGLVKGQAVGFFVEILAELRACGYKVEAFNVDARWFGVPQSRSRIVFVGVRDDIDRRFVPPKPLTYSYSVVEALGTTASYRSSGNHPSCDYGDRPCGCILASSSSHWFVDGDRMAIEQAKLLFGFPRDFVMLGSRAEQWRCLGNCVVPAMASAFGAALRASVLSPPPP